MLTETQKNKLRTLVFFQREYAEKRKNFRAVLETYEERHGKHGLVGSEEWYRYEHIGDRMTDVENEANAIFEGEKFDEEDAGLLREIRKLAREAFA